MAHGVAPPNNVKTRSLKLKGGWNLNTGGQKGPKLGVVLDEGSDKCQQMVRMELGQQKGGGSASDVPSKLGGKA